jgi:hypothetical protein
MKAVIDKKALKTVKTWLKRADSFFKSVKLTAPRNLRALQSESEQVFAILKISANKILIKDQ